MNNIVNGLKSFIKDSAKLLTGKNHRAYIGKYTLDHMDGNA